MSKITKEWLQQKISDMEATRDDIPFGLGEDGTNTLEALRIALASIEAEPVSVSLKLAKLFRKITNSEIDTDGNAHVVLSPADSTLINRARIALAAQAAGPVYQWRERYVDSYLWDDCTKEQYEGFAKRPDVEARILYTAPPAPVVPAELHPDTQKLVTDFCSALAEKLYKAQLKYGYDADWKQDGWPGQCQAHFHQHIAKGDPRDVAAYCAFMWYHGWKTEPAPVSVPDESAVELLVTDLMERIDKITGERHSVATLSSLRISIVEACRAAMVDAGQ